MQKLRKKSPLPIGVSVNVIENLEGFWGCFCKHHLEFGVCWDFFCAHALRDKYTLVRVVVIKHQEVETRLFS